MGYFDYFEDDDVYFSMAIDDTIDPIEMDQFLNYYDKKKIQTNNSSKKSDNEKIIEEINKKIDRKKIEIEKMEIEIKDLNEKIEQEKYVIKTLLDIKNRIRHMMIRLDQLNYRLENSSRTEVFRKGIFESREIIDKYFNTPDTRSQYDSLEDGEEYSITFMLISKYRYNKIITDIESVTKEIEELEGKYGGINIITSKIANSNREISYLTRCLKARKSTILSAKRDIEKLNDDKNRKKYKKIKMRSQYNIYTTETDFNRTLKDCFDPCIGRGYISCHKF